MLQRGSTVTVYHTVRLYIKDHEGLGFSCQTLKPASQYFYGSLTVLVRYMYNHKFIYSLPGDTKHNHTLQYQQYILNSASMLLIISMRSLFLLGGEANLPTLLHCLFI